MYVPMWVLAAIAIAFLALISLARRGRSGERDLIAPPRAGLGGAAPNLPPELASEVRVLSASGRKIDAIKRVRTATGCGLAEAKALVERM